MKKKIIISVIFCVLIVITAYSSVSSAVESYRYDMDPANGVDIFEGFGAALCIGLGALVIFYELDLFYTVYYFFVKPKTKVKTILNIISHLCLVLILAYMYISNIWIGEPFEYSFPDFLRKHEMIPAVLFFIYVGLRLANAMISVMSSDSDENKSDLQ